MKTFTIYARETVYYMKQVKADSIEQAESLAKDGWVDFEYKDIYDGANFEIVEVEPCQN